MSLVNTPATVDAAPEAARQTLEALRKQLGNIPNIFRVLSNSPVTLNGYVDFRGVLAKGRLPAATRERIALAVAEVNGCDYCLSAHSYFGKFSGLDESEVAANRRGGSGDAKAAAAVAFASSIASARGAVSPREIETVRAAGYDDGEIVEIIAHVALNTLTNYVNKALATEIDFPLVHRLAA